MFRVVTVLAAAVVISSAVPTNIFEIDITPEEAQKFLNSPPFTEPQLSGRTAVLPLVRYNDPRFRTAEAGPTLGHYWKNGREIENTEDYLEEVYDAAQYHGQDGLGAYGYGYQTPESSKVENRARSGDVTGTYSYKSGANDDLIKVRYWADSEGFHQEDNLPKVVLKPAEETAEVREARLAHEKAWNEAAAAAAQQPDPQGAYSADYDTHSAAASEPQGSYAAPSQVQPNQVNREGKAYYSAQAQSNYQGPQGQYQSKYQGSQAQSQYQGQPQYQGNQAQYQQQPQYQGNQGQPQYQGSQAQAQYQPQGQGQHQAAQSYQGQAQYGGASHAQGQAQYGGASHAQSHAQYQGASSHQGQYQEKVEEPEPTGPPRGFFYSFNYPVSIIVPKNAKEGQSHQDGVPGPHESVAVSANPWQH